MTYRVVYCDRAFDVVRLAFHRAWEKGGPHAAIDRARIELDELLTSDPLTAGESRTDNERIVFAGPINLLYEPFPAHGVVLIYRANVRN